MNRIGAGLVAFLVCAAASHAIIVFGAPGAIMATARSRFVESGLPLHHWQASPRATPQTQTIVRPSPDLAYAICLIDVREGPVSIVVPTGPGYGSLAIFDSQTDNVFVTSLDAAEARRAEVMVIVALVDEQLVLAEGAELVRVNAPEALALIRRLAPDDARHTAAQALVPMSRCSPG